MNKILSVILVFYAVLCVADTNLQLKFSGIDVIVSGQEGVDFAVERLWYDRLSDDDAILYMKSSCQISLQHNDDNIIGNVKVSQVPGAHPGDIWYKIDGDEYRKGHKYATNPPSGSSGLHDPLIRNVIVFKYDETGSFDLGSFKGKIGPNQYPMYDVKRFHYGMIDSCGDEWHMLTYWDDDHSTNPDNNRSLASSDGKILPIVLDPRTPAIIISAPAGAEFYTTPPKTYYTPHIHEQISYVTDGCMISLYNLHDLSDLYYRINNEDWITYTGQLAVSDLFVSQDMIYQLYVRIGENGPEKLRTIHYHPSQPAQDENHPRLGFAGTSDIADVRAKMHGGDPNLSKWYTYLLDDWYQTPQIDFRCGMRNYDGALGDAYDSYFYMAKNIMRCLYNNAFIAVIDNNIEKYTRVKNGLLTVFTVDPIACEDGDGRTGGPCQERAMYSDGRVLLKGAAAYDMIFNYTINNGYPDGMTPIQHIKIRDNLANEASILMKYPETWPTYFFDTMDSQNNPRHVQLEASQVSFALAMPTYDTHYYGTSGADGTPATHLNAPLVEMPLTWMAVHHQGEIRHPSDPSLGRSSAFRDTFPNDGLYVGRAREGYMNMMYQDLLPFIEMRYNFDGFHYENIENHLMKKCVDRYPYNGQRLPVTYHGTGYNERAILFSVIKDKFEDAPLYRWSMELPTAYTHMNYTMDSSVPAEPPQFKEIVGDNYVLYSSDFNDPKSILFRCTMLNSPVELNSGMEFNYWGGHFNLTAYGERLAIELAGYHQIDYQEVINSERKNVILIDDEGESNWLQFKGGVRHSLVNDSIIYSCLESDHSIPGTYYKSSYIAKKIDIARHVFFPDRKFIIMVDQLISGTGSHEYAWVLHGA
ncbi:MAG: hypothetical protein GF384_01055, partial [Elusimicrobia bacterium]|nr:hypothetical protein [Elusimicrobiota bacterium]